MISVPYTLQFSHCSQEFSERERWWTLQGSYSLFPDCRFQCLCRSLGCFQLHIPLQKLSPPPLLLYPMNLLHCFRSPKYFRYFGTLPLFLSNYLGPFCSRLSPYGLLTPQVLLRTYSAHEVWSSHRYVVVVVRTQLAMR